MAVYSKTFRGFVGLNYINPAELANVTILHVSRNDRVYYPTFNEEASDLQYIYLASSGRIVFAPGDTFVSGVLSGGAGSIANAERILVKWKV